MNEFDNTNINTNANDDEMTRIQNEIDKALNAPQTSGKDVADTQTPDQVQPQQPEIPGQISLSPESAHIENLEHNVTVEPMFSEHVQGEKSMFYKETIKQESKPKERSGMSRTVAAILVVCLLGGTTAGYAIGANFPGFGRHTGKPEDATASPHATSAIETDNDQEQPAFTFANEEDKPAASSSVYDLQSMSDQFVDIVKNVEPAVVAITTIEASTQDFFNMPREQASGSASGIIFSENDDNVYIVTNQHVINNASRVNVSVEGSDPVPARHIGSDAGKDLAVISIAKSDLKGVNIDKVTIAKFGDSDKVEMGQMVLAIGNAFGQGNTSTMGLVSAKEKEVQVSERSAPLSVIQTSATINFGNSGGPLVNLNGEVIGINTAKLSTTYGAEGTGFSIAINRVKETVEDFMNRSTRPFLGITGATITADISAMYNLPEAGVFVNSVFEGSSAEKAGIRRTDIITSVNGEAVFTMEQLTNYLSQCKVGDVVKIGLIRDGKTHMTVDATLAKYDDTEF